MVKYLFISSDYTKDDIHTQHSKALSNVQHSICEHAWKSLKKKRRPTSDVLLSIVCMQLEFDIFLRFLSLCPVLFSVDCRFLRLPPPCGRWRGVLGFVPAGSVSSSSIFEIFPGIQAAICDGLSFFPRVLRLSPPGGRWCTWRPRLSARRYFIVSSSSIFEKASSEKEVTRASFFARQSACLTD